MGILDDIRAKHATAFPTRVNWLTGEDIGRLLGEVDSALASAQSRIAELERMVVFCVDQGVWRADGPETFIDCDGTPASILAAVEKAVGGGK